MDVFISHSSLEAALANWLRDWIQQNVSNTTAFCSSVPDDLPPGDDWFREIVNRARTADHCLILLSPDSLDKHWLYFEAGLTLGATEIHKLIPVLYGGLRSAAVPGPLRHRQALVIDDRASFNAFVNHTLAAHETDHWYEDFRNNLPSPVARLMTYGLYGGLFGDCTIHRDDNLDFRAVANQEFVRTISRVSGTISGVSGRAPEQIVAVRATVVPRRQGAVEHWKFGVQLRKSSAPGVRGRIFELHSGVHDGRASWSIYDAPDQLTPFNFPAHLAREEEHRLEVWLSNDGNFVTCVGVDSQWKRVCLANERGEMRWRLADRDWDEVVVKAWGDTYDARVTVNTLEIHRTSIFTPGIFI